MVEVHRGQYVERPPIRIVLVWRIDAANYRDKPRTTASPKHRSANTSMINSIRIPYFVSSMYIVSGILYLTPFDWVWFDF